MSNKEKQDAWKALIGMTILYAGLSLITYGVIRLTGGQDNQWIVLVTPIPIIAYISLVVLAFDD